MLNRYTMGPAQHDQKTWTTNPPWCCATDLCVWLFARRSQGGVDATQDARPLHNNLVELTVVVSGEVWQGHCGAAGGLPSFLNPELELKKQERVVRADVVTDADAKAVVVTVPNKQTVQFQARIGPFIGGKSSLVTFFVMPLRQDAHLSVEASDELKELTRQEALVLDKVTVRLPPVPKGDSTASMFAVRTERGGVLTVKARRSDSCAHCWKHHPRPVDICQIVYARAKGGQQEQTVPAAGHKRAAPDASSLDAACDVKEERDPKRPKLA